MLCKNAKEVHFKIKSQFKKTSPLHPYLNPSELTRILLNFFKIKPPR